MTQPPGPPRPPSRRPFYRRRQLLAVAAAGLAALGVVIGLVTTSGPAHPSTAAPTPTTTTPFFRPGQVLFGAYHRGGNYRLLDRAVGSRVRFVKAYQDWTSAFPTAAQRALAAQGRTWWFAWESRYYSGGEPPASLTAIAAGDYDQVINAEAARIKAFRRPVWIDFDHEMDNPAAPFGPITPAAYVAAYRHIVTRFRADGASNVTWVWVVTGYHPTAEAYYPGDGYVDVVAADPYNLSGCRSGAVDPAKWRNPYQVLDLTNWLHIDHPSKPMALGEYGSVADPTNPGRRAQWFAQFPAALAVHPWIRAVQLFDSTALSSCPLSIDADPGALAAWGAASRAVVSATAAFRAAPGPAGRRVGRGFPAFT